MKRQPAFNPVALETPESIAFDRDGNTFISLALTGEIRIFSTTHQPSLMRLHLRVPGAPLSR